MQEVKSLSLKLTSARISRFGNSHNPNGFLLYSKYHFTIKDKLFIHQKIIPYFIME
jgi:hypothetical protein